MRLFSRTVLLGLVSGLGVGAVSASDEFERAPIRYSEARPDNAVARLQARLEAGKATLTFDGELGYLRSVLKELQIPVSSQVLVFSKTSLQRHKIGPKRPRAIFFNDDIYIGHCRNGAVIEVSVADPNLGGVFYTLEQSAEKRPAFVRQTESCLLCHGSSQTRGVPGHLVRSVYPDSSGLPVLSAGTHRTDQSSPLERRWGGWYVTGTTGTQSHLGNVFLNRPRPPEDVAKLGGVNLTDLTGRFDTSAYPSVHSDVVALMVLEHQVEAHNLLTRASFQTRLALHDQRLLNKELGRAADTQSETTYRRIKSACEPLVRYMLFGGEAKLTDKVKGTSSFTEEFARRGPRDGKGRSLRDLDLEKRLFKYPCSYLIYSPVFDALPDAAKDYVLRRIHDVLTGRDWTGEYDHLSAEDRQAILEILCATKRDLPAYWHNK